MLAQYFYGTWLAFGKVEARRQEVRHPSCRQYQSEHNDQPHCGEGRLSQSEVTEEEEVMAAYTRAGTMVAVP